MKTHFFSRRAGSVRQEVAQFFFSLSNLFSHKVTNVLSGSERDPLILLSPPLQPHGEWSSSGWGSPEFFLLFFFSGRNFSEVRSRASEVHTRALSNGQKTQKKNTGIRISLRVVVVAGRLVVDQSAGALVVIVGRGGGFEVGQVSGRYANVLCPPFFCDFFCPALFMIVSRSARISVTCTYPPTARTIFIFRFRNFKVFFWRPVKCRVRMF